MRVSNRQECLYEQANIAGTVGHENTYGTIVGRVRENPFTYLVIGPDDQIGTVFAEMQARHGQIDVVVNNAGISHVDNILEISADDWERVMRVNVRGVFLCTRDADTTTDWWEYHQHGLGCCANSGRPPLELWCEQRGGWR